jgi:phosphate transport system substrate-binding protein
LPALLAAYATAQCAAADIVGAGSTAARPIYERWGAGFKRSSGTTLVYEAIGSAAGLERIKAGSVDFGASDVPLDPVELEHRHLIDFPIAIGGVVPIVHLPGVGPGELKLTGGLLARILLGEVTQWNAPEISEFNPGMKLPAIRVVVLGRAEGSGTTYVLSDYLGKVSAAWKDRMGTNFVVPWGAAVRRVRGTDGMIAALAETPGALGYAEYGSVVRANVAHVQLRNHDGLFVQPGPESFTAALRTSEWSTRGRFEQMLTDLAGSRSWPITSGTFAIVRKVARAPERARATLGFFTWGFLRGDGIVRDAHYIALPDRTQARVVREMSQVVDPWGTPIRWDMPN